jgi:phage regulator Rha-like protein
MNEAVLHERIKKRIHELRGKKVILDADLAELYGVETRALNQAVTRNIERFPEDFMFTLTFEEARASRSQNVIMKRGENVKYPPRAFTEHGILMLSSVLRSETAIQVNIQIMRTFLKMREMIQGYRELIERVQKMERRQDVEGREIWKAIRLLQSTVST